MSRRTFLHITFLTAVFSAAVRICAQEPELNPIKWTIAAQSSPVPSGNKLTIELRASIDRGWHLYSTEKVEGGPSPTRITLTPGQSFEVAGEIDSPAPRSAFDPNFQVATEFYEGEVAFAVPIKATSSAAAGQVRFQVRYQTCTPTICLPPKLIDLEATLSGETRTTAASSTAAGNKVNGEGEKPVDFNFVDFSGKSRQFSEFRGRVVLLDFWASWCSPCLADIPQLKGAYQKYRSQGFEILGMDSETLGQQNVDAEFARDSQAKAREIVSTRGVSWTQATAESAVPVAAGAFGIQNLPAKILVDKNGRVIARIKDVAELDQILPKLLGGEPQ